MQVPQSISVAQSGNFYSQIVFRLLSGMKKGSLKVNLPEGIQISFGEGNEILAEITVHNKDFFRRCVLYGDVGFGEAYVDGDWDSPDVYKVISWFLLNIENAPSISGSAVKALSVNILKFFNRFSHLVRRNSLEGSRKNISEHYDLNNDFFALWLDRTMTYSSGLFERGDEDLETAQLQKFERLCEQLKLKNTDHVLEIGCGWGGMSMYMARNYRCRVTAITISEEQYKYARKAVEDSGLQDLVEIRLQDYRKVEGQFDKIVSIEMLEAVGARYLDIYFRCCHELLKPQGLLALQVITCPDSRFESLKNGVDWIQKYIFPGSLLPSVAAINKSINSTGDMSLINLFDFGRDYAKTLKIWKKNFNEITEKLPSLGFDNRFVRKWNYYLNYCEAAFYQRNINVMHLVYSRPNNISYN